jgi:hypothetical protein
MVDQLADLFRTTHKVKTQQVVKSRGHQCGDIEKTLFHLGFPIHVKLGVNVYSPLWLLHSLL